MSGATVPYNLRYNKYAERQLFVELLRRYSQWHEIAKYLYVGFGGIYFEDFKLLHNNFGVEKMLSLESEEWILPRQEFNLPIGCIMPSHQTSGTFIRNVDAYRKSYSTDNIAVWLDYTKPSDLPAQLSEIRALVPKLMHGDILKITLSAHTYWLDGGSGTKLVNRLDNLNRHLGSTYLADGLTVDDVRNETYPTVLQNAIRRQIANGLEEHPGMEFMPMGCYVYSDGTPMLTVTGALVARAEVPTFVAKTALEEMELCSKNWELHNLKVPVLSLRERLELDSLLFEKIAASTLPKKRTAEEIAAVLQFKFDSDNDQSLELIANYIKLYKYQPNYQRVEI